MITVSPEPGKYEFWPPTVQTICCQNSVETVSACNHKTTRSQPKPSIRLINLISVEYNSNHFKIKDKRTISAKFNSNLERIIAKFYNRREHHLSGRV